MDTGTGWKALQQRRCEMLKGFDREASALVRRMFNSIPTAIITSAPKFADRFMAVSCEAWEKWLVEPPSSQADLAIQVSVESFMQAVVIRQEEEALKKAWEPYARVNIRRPGPMDGVVVDIVFL